MTAVALRLRESPRPRRACQRHRFVCFGHLVAELDADRAASALPAGVQGGVVIMVATGYLSNLEAALDTGIQSLRRAG
jgi:hypothetical protein